jgi:hypothetical protein
MYMIQHTVNRTKFQCLSHFCLLRYMFRPARDILRLKLRKKTQMLIYCRWSYRRIEISIYDKLKENFLNIKITLNFFFCGLELRKLQFLFGCTHLTHSGFRRTISALTVFFGVNVSSHNFSPRGPKHVAD